MINPNEVSEELSPEQITDIQNQIANYAAHLAAHLVFPAKRGGTPPKKMPRPNQEEFEPPIVKITRPNPKTEQARAYDKLLHMDEEIKEDTAVSKEDTSCGGNSNQQDPNLDQWDTLHQLLEKGWSNIEISEAFPFYQNADLDRIRNARPKLSDQDGATIQKMVNTRIDDSLIVKNFKMKVPEKDIRAFIATLKEPQVLHSRIKPQLLTAAAEVVSRSLIRELPREKMTIEKEKSNADAKKSSLADILALTLPDEEFVDIFGAELKNDFHISSDDIDEILKIRKKIRDRVFNKDPTLKSLLKPFSGKKHLNEEIVSSWVLAFEEEREEEEKKNSNNNKMLNEKDSLTPQQKLEQLCREEERGFALGGQQNPNLNQQHQPPRATIVTSHPIPEAKFIKKENGLNLYLLPSKPKWKSGAKPQCFMVFGESGAGKTTTLNALANYVMNVQFEDSFRYKLVQDSDDQSASQTQAVIEYNIENGEQRYTLVDSPGFGDTKGGVERDEQITTMICNHFQNCLEDLNYVLVVVKGSDSRLTERSRWVYFKMMEFFGKNVAHNMLIMATFCDGAPLLCQTALDMAGVPYKKIFRFNNSGIFQNPNNGDITKQFWVLGMESFRKFFEFIKDSSPMDLSQTKQVIRLREKFQNELVQTYEEMNISQLKYEELIQTAQEMSKLDVLAKDSKGYEFYVQEPDTKITNISGQGIHTTTCTTCNFTCHKNCTFADDNDKQKCVAMDTEGNCTSCPQKCTWTMHKNLPYIYEVTTKSVKKTHENLKKQYCETTSKLSQHDQILNGIKKDLKRQAKHILGLMNKVADCQTKLATIALKPDPFEALPFVENMMKSELAQKKEGWLERHKQLEKMRDRMLQARKIKECDFVSLFSDYDKEIEELIEEIRSGKKTASSSVKFYGQFQNTKSPHHTTTTTSDGSKPRTQSTAAVNDEKQKNKWFRYLHK